MKLTIELVPETAFYKNLRNALIERGKKDIWDKIRHKAYIDSYYKCNICGIKNEKLECHEIWEYDDVAGIQTLKGFYALCRMCHLCKHMGLANILHQQGKLNIKDIIAHFAKVNSISIQSANIEIKKAFEIWLKRSKRPWKQELGEWAEYLQM